ncbi:GIY-YIG nuclease family protein [Croceicoccus sp. Ery15]|uniref:GIY-YIG nuclease family protein n=1 Tax=Croceicoccus sp. Ery15 TaxID=1703338 RepID=UPI001E3F8169|nr:GIY-YIG nuclease family protein [Croceicoccus sp. Ery15]
MKRVYFIKPVGMDGPVKIGCSQSPTSRRDALSTWSPFELEIVAEIEGGFDTEQCFHAMFEEQHQRREWFSWSEQLQDVIDSINAGTFDFNDLPGPKRITGNAGKTRRKRTVAECYRASAMRRMHNSPSDWGKFYYPALRRILPERWRDDHWFANRNGIEKLILNGGGKPSRTDWDRRAAA